MTIGIKRYQLVPMTDEEMTEKIKTIKSMIRQEARRIDTLPGSPIVYHHFAMLDSMEWLVEVVNEQRKRLREAGVDNSTTME